MMPFFLYNRMGALKVSLYTLALVVVTCHGADDKKNDTTSSKKSETSAATASAQHSPPPPGHPGASFGYNPFMPLQGFNFDAAMASEGLAAPHFPIQSAMNPLAMASGGPMIGDIPPGGFGFDQSSFANPALMASGIEPSMQGLAGFNPMSAHRRSYGHHETFF